MQDTHRIARRPCIAALLLYSLALAQPSILHGALSAWANAVHLDPSSTSR